MLTGFRKLLVRAADRRRHARQMAVAERVMRDRRALLAGLADDGHRP